MEEQPRLVSLFDITHSQFGDLITEDTIAFNQFVKNARMDFLKRFYSVWLPVESFKIDYKYQRYLKRSHVVRIAREWDPLQCRPVVTNARTKEIIDGQQHVAAAILRGDIPELPVIYVDGDARSQSAAAGKFVSLNTNTVRVSTNEIVNAQLAMMNREYCEMEELLNKYGMTINSKLSASYNFIKSYESIRSLLDMAQDKDEAIEALTVLSNGGRVSAHMILAVKGIIYRHNQNEPSTSLITLAKTLRNKFDYDGLTHWIKTILLGYRIGIHAASAPSVVGNHLFDKKS